MKSESLLLFSILAVFLAVLIAGGPKGCQEDLEKSRPQLPTALVTKVGVPAKYKGHDILVEKVETVRDFIGTRHRVHLRVDGKPMLLDPGEPFYTLVWINRDFAFYFDPNAATKLVLNKVSPDQTELEWAEVPAGWSEKSAMANGGDGA